MELADYNIIFVDIKGKNNVLEDAIYRLKMSNIYEVPLENPKVQVVNTTQLVTEIHATTIQTSKF